ncbi:MAG TPA: right-handed parallel beta-helix repeat-containing protein [Bryobacteraceae bacterium]|nr:right-handed parallel beta-helix repeat-containing protein [Bryobacteraceae bacterium]
MVTGRRFIIHALIFSAWASYLRAAPAFVSACDLNADGLVNVIDIQLAIDQALGIFPCTNGDLNGDGQCNVVDVQRIINATLGAGCKAGNGASWYVSPSGNDNNSCAQTSPCRQISQALTIVQPGDTIFVADGSYNAFTVDSLNGTAANPITIQALGQNAQILPVSGVRDTIFVTFSSYIVLDGLRSFNANRAAIRIDNSPNVTVQNGVYGNNAEWGIFTDFSNNSLIRNNECYGSVAQHGIYISNSSQSPIVRANWLHDNAGAGVQLNADVSQGGVGIITGALLEDNVIYNNGSAGGGAINLDGVQFSTIQNNLLYNNHASGITMFKQDGAAGPVGDLVYNNTIDMASDGRWDLVVSSSVGGNTVRDNILYNENSGHGGIQYTGATDVANTDSDYNIFGGGTYAITPDDGTTFYTLAEWQAQGHEAHSFVATLASLFVNPSAGNYHLLAGSPAIDAGQTLAAVTTDMDGEKRPQGTASDIGCYEFPD